MAAKKRKKGMVVTIFVLVLVALAVATVSIVFARQGRVNASNKSRTYMVTKEVVQNVIEISGNVEAAQSQSLQAAGDGQVMAVYAKQGDHVKKDQVLVELDTSEQEYEIAKLNYDIAQVKITGNAKELELKQIQRRSLMKRLEDRKIIASFDGILADFDVTVGEYLEAKDSVGTLVERSYLKSYVEVVETDAPKLAANQTVYCTFPAYGEEPVKGYVVSYPQVGTLTSRGASVVKVEIRIDNPPELILPNYSFTGEIEISPPQTLLLAENEAVGFSDGQAFVEVVSVDGDKQRVVVAAEPYGMTHMRILSGDVAEGDVLAPQVAPPVSGMRPVIDLPSVKGGENARPGGAAGGLGGRMPPVR